MLPFGRMTDTKSAYFQMKGREVFRFAVEKGTQVITNLLEKRTSPLIKYDASYAISHVTSY